MPSPSGNASFPLNLGDDYSKVGVVWQGGFERCLIHHRCQALQFISRDGVRTPPFGTPLTYHLTEGRPSLKYHIATGVEEGREKPSDSWSTALTAAI